MKDEHTIIEKWPFRLKLQPGQHGGQEEFDRMLRGGVSGKERYAEWTRSRGVSQQLSEQLSNISIDREATVQAPANIPAMKLSDNLYT